MCSEGTLAARTDIRGWAMLVLLNLMSSLVTAVIGVVGWRQRRTVRAGLGLALAMTGLVIWGLASVPLRLLLTVAEVPGALMYSVLVTLPAASIGVTGFFLMCEWTADPQWQPSRQAWVLLGLEPGLTTLATITNPWLHLLLAEQHPAYTQAPLYWVHALYSYGLLLVAVVRLVRASWHASAAQQQTAGLLVGALIAPVVLTLLITFLPGAPTAVDLAGFAILPVGLMCGYAMFRGRVLMMVPVARGLVLHRLSDAVIVLDPATEMADANPAAVRLLRALDPSLPVALTGLPSTRLFGGTSTAAVLTTRTLHAEIDGSAAVFDVKVDEVRGVSGRRLADVIVIRDVTELHRQRIALAEANRRLQGQLETIERLRAELAEQAIRDELTGAFNRRHLMAELATAIRRARGDGSPLAVLMIDLDHFKAINDGHGHLIGDDVLRRVAGQLGATLGGRGMLARYGGEEFIALLPGVEEEQARALAESLRRRCTDLLVRTSTARISLTVSIGIAVLDPGRARDGDGAGTELIQRADEALYAAKAGGRNRVVAAGQQAQPGRGSTAGELSG